MRYATLLTVLLATATVQAQEDRAARTLAVWDTNGDGVLTPDEFPDHLDLYPSLQMK